MKKSSTQPMKQIVENIDSGLLDWDKSHKDYRNFILYNFLHEIQEKWVNNVRFEGDKDLKLPMQKTLLRHFFRYGNASITDLSKKMKISTPLEKAIIKNLSLDKMVLYVNGALYDNNEMIYQATGNTSPHSSLMNGSYKVDRTNSAFLQSHHSWSMLLKWLPYAYMYATLYTIFKKRIALLDGKLVQNTANNSVKSDKFSAMYDIDETMIDVNPNQNDETVKIDLSAMISTKLQKLDFSNGETIGELIESIQSFKNQWLKDLGERTNTNVKQERNISNEFIAEEVHYALTEQTFKDEVEMFIEQYQDVFGVVLTPIFKIDEVIKEQKEDALKQAGQANGDTPKEDN